MTVSVGAGLGVISVPPAFSVAVSVMVPATVPVASAGELEKTAAVDPAGMLNVTEEVSPPPELTNPTSVGLPPTADWKLAVNVPVSATGYGAFNVNPGDACVAAVPPMLLSDAGGAGGSVTVIVIVAVAVCFCESVTVSVTLGVPAAVGVPVIELPVTLKPAGNPVAENVYGGVPPVAVNGSETAVPTVAEKLVVVMVNGEVAALMARLNCPFAVCPLESATVTVNTVEPVAVGVPVMPPEVLFKFKPGGSDPDVTDQVYGVMPPLAASEPE